MVRRFFDAKHAQVRDGRREQHDLPLEAVALQMKASATSPARFGGYGSVWNRIDSYGDTVAKGAFSETLKTRKPMMFFAHSPSRVPGKWLSAKEDDKGLYLDGELTPGHSEAADVAAALKHGSISGLSIGGYTRDADYREDGTRVIKAFELYEVSIVSMPAENEARIDTATVKSLIEQCTTIRQMEDLLRDEAGLSTAAATAYVARMKRLLRGDPAGDAPSSAATELIGTLKGITIPTSLFSGG